MIKEANILVFGGTTEGKAVAWLLDQLGYSYIYSSKTKVKFEGKGKLINGALHNEALAELCLAENVKLIIDAAHPFAEVLHRTVLDVAQANEITTIRYERIFPSLDDVDGVCLFDSYEQMVEAALAKGFKHLLALTGVQTISKMQALWLDGECYFRILDTERSMQMARKSGLPQDYVIAMMPRDSSDEVVELMKQTQSEVVLSKESGVSGFFEAKLAATRQLNIPLWVVRRPMFDGYSHSVSALEDLQSLLYGLYKTHLNTSTDLRGGFTTGTCTTAAATAAFKSLFNDEAPRLVDVQLPDEATTSYVVYPTHIDNQNASCIVIKDAGDDPDATHGHQIGCHVSLTEKPGISFKRGLGIGLVTLPGLPIPPGEPAINPTPRLMIKQALLQLSLEYDYTGGIEVTPFVPKGESIAKRTFNPRIGILDGISILGTTGYVMPYSNEAFLASIANQVDVVLALDNPSIVLTSGLRSENRMKLLFPSIADAAYVHFGNLVGGTLSLCSTKGVKSIYISLMLGKAIKLAEGNADTHSKKVVFNPTFAMELARQSGIVSEKVEALTDLTLANAIPEIISFVSDRCFYELLTLRCLNFCKTFVSSDCQVTFALLLPNDELVLSSSME